jgi:hypothetical protein
VGPFHDIPGRPVEFLVIDSDSAILCTENQTCAWLATDDTTPTLANDPSMGFGPGSYVVKNWMDDVVVGPWVSLVSTPSAVSTLLQMQ